MIRLVLITVLVAASAGAQQPQVRLLNAPDARTTRPLKNVVGVRQLPNGTLLVNDTQRRQVVVLDANLGEVGVALDSASGVENAYGPRAGGLIAYAADSTLFFDPTGLSMFVIDPSGKVARVGSIPRSQDAGSLASSQGGWPGLDGKGRLVYRGALAPQRATNGGMTMGQSPDSLEIVRVNVATRKLDTAGFVRIPKVKISVTRTEQGMSVAAELNPVQTIDEWAVLSDGSVMFVRGLDYRADIISPSGALSSGPKIPFEWKPLSDEDKVALLDSVKREMDRPSGGPSMGTVAAGHGAPPSSGSSGHTLSAVTLAPASALPDYMPAFTQGSVKADADGNLWIRTTARRAGAIGGRIYDVVDRTGKLIDRVQAPAGRRVIGFGPRGVVYLIASDESGSWIERTRR